MLLNHNDAKYYVLINFSSVHEVINKFLLYDATLSSSVLVKHMFIVVKTDWLTKHSTVDCCCLVNQAC